MRSASAQKPPEIFAPIPDSESGVITPLVNHVSKTECLLLPILLQTSGNNLSQFADVPRKGNVDRNVEDGAHGHPERLTFPARGTWIEIYIRPSVLEPHHDVPRKGNVDRNPIMVKLTHWQNGDVPRKGNVDRNILHLR